tara:strand:- start:688 stop:1326 length:639 start_codon:yes stop_codon:yes gene_type:complete
MTIPIDYNKMQNILDKRHYMGHIYTGKIETWRPTKLGLKTYGKWCDLVGWENLSGEKESSTDEFMNLAIKRNWVEVIYDFQKKENVCMHTKLGHDLFRTFEYWIDTKTQNKTKQKETAQKVAKSGLTFMSVTLPKIIQGITEMMAGLSKGMSSLDYQNNSTKKSTAKKRSKDKTTKSKKPKNEPSDTFNVNDPSWNNWSNANQLRKGNWWEI